MSGDATKSAARVGEPQMPTIDAFRGQHLQVAERQIATELGRTNVTIDAAERPLAWLARRRGRNGRALIELHSLRRMAARRFHLRAPDAACDVELGKSDLVWTGSALRTSPRR